MPPVREGQTPHRRSSIIVVSDDGHDPSDSDPFGAMNQFMQDISRMFTQPGGGAGWDRAAQIAASIANEGRTESNVDPLERAAIEQLARVAELQIAAVTGREHDAVIVEPLNRGQWAKRFLDDEHPLLEGLSGSIGAALRAQLGQLQADADGEGLADLGLPQIPGMTPDALMRQMMDMLGPSLLSMMAGSTAGHLASRALGHYELPLPRSQNGPLTLVLDNADTFADDWSLPKESIRLWVCLSDVAHHGVLTIPHVRAHLDSLLGSYVNSFSQDPAQIERRLAESGLVDDLMSGSEPELEAMQRLAGDPEVLLAAMQSDEQRHLQPQIEAVVATIEGYVDRLLDRLGSRLIPDYDRVTEALRRRRVEAGPASRFVERLFGLGLSQATFDRGIAFVDGVVERAGDEALEQLWSDVDHLPTPNELDAPGLWLARLGIDATDVDLADEIIEIPDFIDFDDDPPS